MSSVLMPDLFQQTETQNRKLTDKDADIIVMLLDGDSPGFRTALYALLIPFGLLLFAGFIYDLCLTKVIRQKPTSKSLCDPSHPPPFPPPPRLSFIATDLTVSLPGKASGDSHCFTKWWPAVRLSVLRGELEDRRTGEEKPYSILFFFHFRERRHKGARTSER